MELLPQSLIQRFAVVGRQEDVTDPVIVAHFFNPAGAGDWYATEYDTESEEFFGYVSIFGDHNDEWGSFSRAELAAYKGSFGLGIERDLHWKEKPASQVIRDFSGWGQ